MKRNELIKQHFCNTLMDMCETRKLGDITVMDLVKEADMARQTFYNHFADINDLICYTASRPILSDSSMPYNRIENLSRMFETARQHRGFFSQLPLQVGQNSFRSAYNAWICRTWEARAVTDDLSELERATRRAQIKVYAEGTTAMLMEYLASDMSVPTDVYMQTVILARPDWMKDYEVPAGTELEYPR